MISVVDTVGSKKVGGRVNLLRPRSYENMTRNVIDYLNYVSANAQFSNRTL